MTFAASLRMNWRQAASQSWLERKGPRGTSWLKWSSQKNVIETIWPTACEKGAGAEGAMGSPAVSIVVG